MSAKAEFFEQDSFVLVGDSRSKRFPATSEKYLKEAGKTVHSVDIGGGGEGRLASLDDVPAGVETAIVEVAKDRTSSVVAELLDRGYQRLWLHQNTDTEEALRLIHERGAQVETGGCAVMYVAPATTPHMLHRAIWKMLGRY